MLWQVRAVVKDRPGSVAALAASFGVAGANILALEIFPTGGGCVVDELVLSTADGWTAGDVEELCGEAGVVCVVVRRASTRVLEDQPVRWLRAAQALLADPERLEEQLCTLLGAAPSVPSQEAGLTLTQGAGPSVRITRDVAFTDTEVGRATELRRFAGAALRAGRTSTAPESRREPVTGAPSAARHQRPRAQEVVVRPGVATDAEALVAMHHRCSAEVLLRRYRQPVGRLTPRDAVALLEPEGGRSVVVLEGDDLVAAGLVVPDGDQLLLALHVEDARQRRGLGARLLRALAVEAVGLGWDEVVCLVQPGDSAVLSTVRRAGLLALVSYADGTCHHRLPLARLRSTPSVQASPPAQPRAVPASEAREVDDLLAQTPSS